MDYLSRHIRFASAESLRAFMVAIVALSLACLLVLPGCTFVGALSVSAENAVYTGSAIETNLRVTDGGKQLVFDRDYTVTWKNNIEVGTASVTVSGKGSYIGEATCEFEILPAPIENVEVLNDSTVFTGKEIEPEIELAYHRTALVEGTDYEIERKTAKDAGTIKMTLTGKGNFTGKTDIEYTVERKPLEKSMVKKIKAQAYTSEGIEPRVEVADMNATLKEGKDYSVSYKNNVNAGKATAVVEGKGNYTGTVKVKFRIKPRSLKDVDIVPIPNQSFYGEPVEPEVLAIDGEYSLVPDEDYIVVYLSNEDCGDAQAIIRGKGNYEGGQAIHFTIENAGDAIARAACRVSYSRGVYYGGGTNGSYPYTALWHKVYSQVCPGSPWYRSCIAAVKGIVRWSGYDASFPLAGKGYEHYIRSHGEKWQILGEWDGNIESLMPGDILTAKRNGVIGGDNVKDHSFIYVGPDIAMEVYEEYLKGTDADLGEPVEGSVFVSSHGGGGLQSKRSAAPCICTASFALAYYNTYVVIRPVGNPV